MPERVDIATAINCSGGNFRPRGVASFTRDAINGAGDGVSQENTNVAVPVAAGIPITSGVTVVAFPLTAGVKIEAEAANYDGLPETFPTPGARPVEAMANKVFPSNLD